MAGHLPVFTLIALVMASSYEIIMGRWLYLHCTVCSRAAYDIELGILVHGVFGRIDIIYNEHAKRAEVYRH